MTARRAPDQAQRDAAVAERARNVLVDAGAGTGKTTLLVGRLVAMVAPRDDGPARELSRIAAITFTRKAAGELRFRIRETLLRELGRPGLTATRRGRLSAAVAAADTAHVSTIHAFADRLLRLRPIEARVSPSYGVVEDEEEVAAEGFAVLLQAVESGTLAQEVAGAPAAGRAGEVQDILLDAIRAEVRAESQEREWSVRAGLDALFRGFLRSRDVPPPDAPPAGLDLERFRALAREFRDRAAGASGTGAGSAWLRRSARHLERLAGVADPVVLFREVSRILARAPGSAAKKREFAGDEAGWKAWKAWTGDGRRPERVPPLEEELPAPLRRWMATRLVRAFPVVEAIDDAVKARRGLVDQVDLLVRLRDLLRGDLAARRFLQERLDHVLVDEFQDTDPLQAEIVLYLCEREPRATDWRDVVLAPGKLTLVGDPKQSIYRFRRADIAVYEGVRRVVARGPCLAVSLTANFRCAPGLVGWLNHRFDDILGRADAGRPAFDAASGTVANEPLGKGREGPEEPAVTLLPYARGDGVDASRAVEAAALASWLRWTVDGRRIAVVDPETRERRPAGYGDVAVLATSTWSLGLLFGALDRLGVPHAARGGTLFLSDPLHRQFLLGLRAIADRDDGVAQAALLRPPFFALELADLGADPAGPRAATGTDRGRAAADLVRELRRRRLDRPPGETARDLLEETGFGRAVALGPNGAQRLERLRELCLELERLAGGGLDYDAATARLRPWATDPIPLDPPRPVAVDAVQVLTVHQAKGLEFPVVALWDGCARWADRPRPAAWTVERDGRRWALALDGLAWEEPAGARILQREQAYLDAERKRLVYVAATRARDRLVLPVAGEADPDLVTGRLAAGAPASLVDAMEPFDPEAPPAWAREVSDPPTREPRPAGGLVGEVDEAWGRASAEACRPRFAPAAVAAEAHAGRADPDEGEGEAGERRKPRQGRHGRAFGEAVHLAIGHALREPSLAAAAAAERGAREAGLEGRRAEAAADVDRALAALARQGLRRVPGPDLRLEYPVAAAAPGGKLLSGFVDLVAAGERRIDVVDFKTDAPPRGDVGETHPEYVAQVTAYGRLLSELGVAAGRTVRCGLLFTADGILRWVP